MCTVRARFASLSTFRRFGSRSVDALDVKLEDVAVPPSDEELRHHPVIKKLSAEQASLLRKVSLHHYKQQP